MLLALRNEIDETLGEAIEKAGYESYRDETNIEMNDPADDEKGMFSSPVSFQIAADVGEQPFNIAETIVAEQESLVLPDLVSSVTVDNNHINYHTSDEELALAVLSTIQEEGSEYASDQVEGDKIIADVSAPNIAKPLHIGHLRNTVLSEVLTNILEKRGHTVITDNHIGDWGAHVGNLMYEFKEHGSREELEEDPVEYFVDLYQQFGQREQELADQEKEKELEELRSKGGEWFRKLETGDEEATEFWRLFREKSIERFEETYDRLGVEFDYWLGESVYARSGLADRVIEDALELGVAFEQEDGAVSVPVHEDELEGVESPETMNLKDPSELDFTELLDSDDGDNQDERDDSPFSEFVIRKSNGSTLYNTHDVAGNYLRRDAFDADRSIYVVASEQSEYFQQMFTVCRKMGIDEMEFKHVNYGMISLPEGTLSTRRGRVVTVRRVLDEAYERAIKVVEENNPDLPEDKKSDIAKKVALATIKFENVATSRAKDIGFDLEETISFQGDTGPYIQYAATRAYNILEKADEQPVVTGDGTMIADYGKSDLVDQIDLDVFNDVDMQLIRHLGEYSLVIEECEEKYDAAPLGNYLIKLASDFNRFYHTNRVLDSENARNERLTLTATTFTILSDALDLMGIEVLKQM